VRNAVKKRTTLRDILINVPEDALDLISSLLVFNPIRRRSAAQGLNHPYVSRYEIRSKRTMEYDLDF
jgi:serine/threonine protein kinase